jgi:hypothetical protein
MNPDDDLEALAEYRAQQAQGRQPGMAAYPGYQEDPYQQPPIQDVAMPSGIWGDDEIEPGDLDAFAQTTEAPPHCELCRKEFGKDQLIMEEWWTLCGSCYEFYTETKAEGKVNDIGEFVDVYYTSLEPPDPW